MHLPLTYGSFGEVYSVFIGWKALRPVALWLVVDSKRWHLALCMLIVLLIALHA